jgi:hypothetical protein
MRTRLKIREMAWKQCCCWGRLETGLKKHTVSRPQQQHCFQAISLIFSLVPFLPLTKSGQGLGNLALVDPQPIVEDFAARWVQSTSESQQAVTRS